MLERYPAMASVLKHMTIFLISCCTIVQCEMKRKETIWHCRVHNENTQCLSFLYIGKCIKGVVCVLSASVLFAGSGLRWQGWNGLRWALRALAFVFEWMKEWIIKPAPHYVSTSTAIPPVNQPQPQSQFQCLCCGSIAKPIKMNIK